MVYAKRQYRSSRLSEFILDPVRPSSTHFSCQTLTLGTLAFIIWAQALLALAGAPVPETDAQAPVTFAVSDVWPWGYADAEGKPRGSLADVMERLSELTGVPVELRLRPARRAINELDSGEINFSILFQSPIQDKEAINLGSVVKFNTVLAAMSNTEYPLNLDEMAGKRIAFIRGAYLGEAFVRNQEVERVPVKLISQALEMLSLGRISAILSSDHSLARTLQMMDLNPDRLRYKTYIRDQSGVLYMSREAPRPRVAEKFRDAIGHLKENGELDKIFFGDSGRPQETSPAAQ